MDYLGLVWGYCGTMLGASDWEFSMVLLRENEENDSFVDTFGQRSIAGLKH